MTASNNSIVQAARSDPVGAGIVVSVVLLVVLAFLEYAPPLDIEMPRWRWPDLPSLIRGPKQVPKPLRKPPEAWRANAAPGDVLKVPGLPVAYWGKPDAAYGQRVTASAQKPVAVVVHFTDDTPALTLVAYQHNGDSHRGGAYGYHVYIDPDGRVFQGAPLSVRTNHVKPVGSPERTRIGTTLDGTNTISVTLVGACRSPPLAPITYRCRDETVTQQQIDAGLAVIVAIRKRFGIACGEVYGHGDLQHDRKSFEGVTLSRMARAACGSAALHPSATSG